MRTAGIAMLVLLFSSACHAEKPAGYAAWRASYERPHAPRVSVTSRSVTMGNVELRYTPDKQVVRMGDVVAWSVVLLNRAANIPATSRVEVEYTAPDGVRITLAEEATITHVGELTLVHFRLYLAPGMEWREGVNTFAAGGYPGQEQPTVPNVRADDSGRVYLGYEVAALPSGRLTALRYTTTAVGVEVAPEGRIVVAEGTIVVDEGPPPVPVFP